MRERNPVRGCPPRKRLYCNRFGGGSVLVGGAVFKTVVAS